MHILWTILRAIGAMTAMITVVIAVHEAGHGMAGRLAGLSWRSWEVGTLRVSREGGRWRLSLAGHWQGGLVKFFPFEKRVTRLQRAMMLLGGVVANLLLSFVLLAYVLRHSLREQTTSSTLAWLGGTAALSFLMGVLNLLPFQSQGFSSDGRQLLWLLRNGKAYREYYAHWDRHDAVNFLHSCGEQGKRPREWDPTQVRRATALRDGSIAEVVAAHHAFYWAADSEDWPESGRYIGRAVALLEMLPGTQRAEVLLDAAYYEGLHLRNGASARELIARAGGIPHRDTDDEALRRSMTLRAEAAALLAEGNLSAAEHTAQEALLSLASVASNSVADQSLIEHLLSCCSLPSGTVTETPTAKE